MREDIWRQHRVVLIYSLRHWTFQITYQFKKQVAAEFKYSTSFLGILCILRLHWFYIPPYVTPCLVPVHTHELGLWPL